MNRINLRGLASRVRSLSLDQKALLAVLAIMAALSIYRALHMEVTSFIVSDEYRYIRDAIGNIQDIAVADRFFFLDLNALLFRVFGIHTLDQFVWFLPFYLFAWSGLTLVMFYKVMKLFGFEERTIALSLVSSLLLISFSLLALGFLTESFGLAMTMVGVWLLVWYAKKGGRRLPSLIAPLMAALFFAAAAFTREPYYMFLVGGIFVIVLIGFAKRKEHLGERKAKRLVWVVLPILIFSVPAGTLSHYPHDFFPGTFNSVLKLVFPPPPPPTIVVTTVTVTTTTVLTLTITEIIAGTNTTYLTTTTTRTNTTQTTTTTTTTSTTNTTVVPPPPSVFHSTLLDTLDVFITGLVLGWTPLVFIFGAVGSIALLYYAVKRKDLSNFSIFALVAVGLGSYLVVSLLTVKGIYFNQDYLSFQHYSTIIRFADTAVPAYFLAAPFAFGLVARKRKWAYATFVGFLVFGGVVAGAYQVFAASNLGVNGNPFSLNYRTGGALVRDYVVSHPQGAPFHIVGFPMETWQLTTGTSGVDTASLDFYANMTQAQFIQKHWSTFYVYTYSRSYTNETAPFLLPLVYSNSVGSLPVTVVGRTVIANSTALILRFDVNWNS